MKASEKSTEMKCGWHGSVMMEVELDGNRLGWK